MNYSLKRQAAVLGFSIVEHRGNEYQIRSNRNVLRISTTR